MDKLNTRIQALLMGQVMLDLALGFLSHYLRPVQRLSGSRLYIQAWLKASWAGRTHSISRCQPTELSSFYSRSLWRASNSCKPYLTSENPFSHWIFSTSKSFSRKLFFLSSFSSFSSHMERLYSNGSVIRKNTNFGHNPFIVFE